MDEILNRILEAEREARRIIDNAYEEARKIEAEASIKADEAAKKVYEEIIEEAKRRAKEEARKIEEEMINEIKSIELNAQNEIENLRKNASKNFERAVELVIAEVLRP